MTKELNERFHRILQRAHEIWENEGRPFNQHEELWHRAMVEIDALASAPYEQPAGGEVSLVLRAASAIENIAPKPERTSLMKRPKFFKMHSSKQ